MNLVITVCKSKNSVHNYVIIMILCNYNIYIAVGHEDRRRE